MQRGHVDAVLLEDLTYPLHFTPQQHKIAGSCCLPTSCCLEVDAGCRSDGWWQRHPVIRDLLGTRETELVDAAIGLALEPRI